MAANHFIDEQIGKVTLRRHPNASGIKIRISVRGEIIATAPRGVPQFMIKQVVKANRPQLEQMLLTHKSTVNYEDNQPIGHSHHLKIINDESTAHIDIAIKDRNVIARVPNRYSLKDPTVQSAIQKAVIKVLRRESKAYLGSRLEVLAIRHNYHYSRIRYTHAGTRWGSCSSNGTISLNIALMKLPLELIDYVLIHELCHTKEMNHSKSFWELVANADKNYKLNRRALKAYSPSL